MGQNLRRYIKKAFEEQKFWGKNSRAKKFQGKSFGEQIILEVETLIWKKLFQGRNFCDSWLKAKELKYVG